MQTTTTHSEITEESVNSQTSESSQLLNTSAQQYGTINDNETAITLPTENESAHALRLTVIKRFIYEHVQPTSSLFINSIIFGGSVKAFLDPIMKALMHDINEALNEAMNKSADDKTFDIHTISKIGAYMALTTGIASYFMYRYMMLHPNIENKKTYKFNKLSQLVGALGLSGYIYTGTNYITTAACSSAYPKHVSICPEVVSGDPRMPLEVFCCIAPGYTTQASIGVATNDYTLVFFNPLGFKVASAAMDALRYDYKKWPRLHLASDSLSIVATASAYAIVRYAIIPSQPLYYTLVPLSTFYLTTRLIPMLVTFPFRKKDYLALNTTAPTRLRQYASTFLKAMASGIGRAALYHAIALTYEVQSLSYPGLERVIGRYILASLTAADIGAKVFYSNSIKDFGQKFLNLIVPEEKFENEQDPASNINWKKVLSIIAATSITGLLTGVFIQQIIENQFTLSDEEDPAKRALLLVNSPGGMALRFSTAGFGLLTYGTKTFWRDYINGFRPTKKIDLNNNLKLNWPSFASIITAMLMMVGIYKAIEDAVHTPNENANLYHKIIMTFLSVMLIGVCLFGDIALKKLHRSNNIAVNSQHDGQVIVNDSSAVNLGQSQPQRSCNPRSWFNNWCNFLGHGNTHNNQVEERSIQSSHTNTPNLRTAYQ